MSDKPTEVELSQVKTAVDYLVNIFEEGSLVSHYERSIRLEVAAMLRILMEKVEGLPVGTPNHLVQAAAVRAIIEAAEQSAKADQNEKMVNIKHHMRQAEVAADLQGHSLGEWKLITASDAEPEYQAVCQNCDGVIYINNSTFYTLMQDECSRIKNKTEKTSEVDLISQETIIALWDLDQKEQD